MKKLLFTLSILCVCFSITNAQIINTIAGYGAAGNSGDGGPATAAEIYYPYGLKMDDTGNLFIAESGGQVVREVNTSGIISTRAGNGVQGFSGDGGPATAAEFYNVCDMALDKSGNIYITDERNNRIRKVNTSGIITTIAGNGVYGFAGDGGAAISSEMAWPSGICLDTAGNIYIADYFNSAIRKINTSGIISTIAGHGGNSGFSGDGGQATAAYLYCAIGVYVNDAGDVYIADSYNFRLRMINTSGIINTIAGNGVGAFCGDGGPATAAELNGVRHVYVDPSTNLIYLADVYNNCVRMVNTSGIISTVAGIGTVIGYSGDGGLATAAELDWAAGIVVSSSGTLYISDYLNNRIRAVTDVTTGTKQLPDNGEIAIYPNPASQTIFIKLDKSLNSGTLTINDVTGKNLLSKKINTAQSNLQIDVSKFANGIYFVTFENAGKKYISKFIKE